MSRFVITMKLGTILAYNFHQTWWRKYLRCPQNLTLKCLESVGFSLLFVIAIDKDTYSSGLIHFKVYNKTK